MLHTYHPYTTVCLIHRLNSLCADRSKAGRAPDLELQAAVNGGDNKRVTEHESVVCQRGIGDRVFGRRGHFGAQPVRRPNAHIPLRLHIMESAPRVPSSGLPTSCTLSFASRNRHVRTQKWRQQVLLVPHDKRQTCRAFGGHFTQLINCVEALLPLDALVKSGMPGEVDDVAGRAGACLQDDGHKDKAPVDLACAPGEQ